jgi:proteasome assembly chaperone (PAC2) family protein
VKRKPQKKNDPKAARAALKSLRREAKDQIELGRLQERTANQGERLAKIAEIIECCRNRRKPCISYTDADNIYHLAKGNKQ